MYQRTSSPQLIGGVLDDAVRLFKAGFKQVIGLAVVSSLLSSFWRLFDNTFNSPLAGSFDPSQRPGWDVVPMLLGALGALYLFLAIVSRMHAFSINRPTTLREALRRALIRYPAMLLCLAAMAWAVASTAVAMIFAIPIFGLGAIVLSLLLLVLVTALIVYWVFAVPLVVTANIGGISALRRSVALVRGNFWRTSTVLVVVFFVQLAVASLIGAVALAFGAVAGLGNLNLDAVVFVVEAAAGGVTTPFIVATMLAMLRDLELRREGEDLAQRIESLR